jgi:signal-transduction protein with cAMP-binding, CBS, and nucleotidyltransferase domain
MNITDYILNDFKPLTLQSTVKEALQLFKTYPITHIPITENNNYIGCISQSDILTIDNENDSLKDQQDYLAHFLVNDEASIVELLKIFANNDTNILPAIVKHQYIGYFELNDILEVFSQSPFLNSDGFILIIQKNNKEYSMSEIAQIVESNNSILLGSYISNHLGDKTEVTLKIASQEINEIIQSFRRYNYTIITEHKDDFYLEELKNRSDYLQKFLNT